MTIEIVIYYHHSYNSKIFSLFKSFFDYSRYLYTNTKTKYNIMTNLNCILLTMLAIASIIYLAVLQISFTQIVMIGAAALILKRFFKLLIDAYKQEIEEVDNKLNKLITN